MFLKNCSLQKSKKNDEKPFPARAIAINARDNNKKVIYSEYQLVQETNYDGQCS
jgi:hypothetical protein